MKYSIAVWNEQHSGHRWQIALALASLASLGFMIGAWLPWLVGTVASTSDLGALHIPVQLTGENGLETLARVFGVPMTLIRVVFPIAWDGIAVLGVLFSSLIWLVETPAYTRLLTRAYGAWAACVTLITVVSAYALDSHISAPPPPGAIVVGAQQTQIAWGFWLTLAALVLGWCACVMLLRQLSVGMRAQAAQTLTERLPLRSPTRRVGAAILTFGALLWLVGFILLPWATVNCAGLQFALAHFTRNACAGIDANDAIAVSISGLFHETLGISDASPVKIEELVIATSVIILSIVWGGISRIRYMWVCIWVLGATLLTLCGAYGVADILAHPFRLTLASAGTWVIGPGLALTCVGIVCSWLGVALLWGNAPRSMRAVESALQ